MNKDCSDDCENCRMFERCFPPKCENRIYDIVTGFFVHNPYCECFDKKEKEND